MGLEVLNIEPIQSEPPKLSLHHTLYARVWEGEPTELQPLFKHVEGEWLAFWFFRHLQAHPELSHSTRNALTDLFVTLKEQL